MSVLFSSGPAPADPQLADLWYLLENERFEEALDLADAVCQDSNAPIEFFCGLSLAYGECGYYAEAEQVARTAISFGEPTWHARHALAVALMHQGRFLGALDTLGFHRNPSELYLVRAQIEKMGGYGDSLLATLEDALEREVPPAVHLYLAYLYGALGEEIDDWQGKAAGFAEVARYADYLDVWERDLARHKNTPYGKCLAQHVTAMRRISR